MEMELRAEKRAGVFLTALLLSPALLAQQSFQYEAWRSQSRVASWPPLIKKAGAPGALTIGPGGVSFERKYAEGKRPKRPQSWRWDYQDIEQLTISPRTLSVLTYQDDKWKLGADRQYDFELASPGSFEAAYQFLKTRLDQRFVAALAESPAQELWELPVKRLTPFGGDEGALQVGTASIVYKSSKPGESRTWRYEDIDNIASSGPFSLTITTFERARLDYGSRKQFNFQLKRPLDEDRYNDLWLRLNRSKGLKALGALYN
jgi:hypothetical protein